MRRFFVDPQNINGPTAFLEGQEARHIAKVLRLTPGTKVILFDGSGSYFETELTLVSPSRVEARIASIIPYIESAQDSLPSLHLAMGLVKGKKMDLIIQKITELGVNSLLPFSSRYCAVREHEQDRRERWEKIAREACKQCNRPKPPVISPARDFRELLNDPEHAMHDLKLFFWENRDGQLSIRAIFEPLKTVRSVLAIIGPEGGFSTDEAEMAAAAGLQSVTLGSRILRSETAAVAVAAILQHELGNLA